jgi:hypothetical protein
MLRPITPKKEQLQHGRYDLRCKLSTDGAASFEKLKTHYELRLGVPLSHSKFLDVLLTEVAGESISHV